MRKSNPPLDGRAAPIARLIHGILLASGRHHVDVSLEAGLGRDYLRDLFRGKSQKPNYADLVRVIEALGADPAALSEHGATPSYKEGGDQSYTKEESALLDLWRLLSDAGQHEALGMIARLIIKHPRRQ